jgi:ATP-binding cassette subfamily B protein
VDGVDTREFSPASWHDAVFIVEQDAFLFHGTLRENVLYACADTRGDALPAAIATANLDDVVANLPNGLDTLVGDRVAMRSCAPRQREAIRRGV